MTLSAFESFLETTKRELSRDERFLALLAGGSLLSGTMDEFSDLDLILVYAPEHREAIMADRLSIAGRFGSLLSAFTGEHVGEPRLVICLFGPPALHVDLKFVTPSELERRIENPSVLWERGAEIGRVLERTSPAYPALDRQAIEDRFWVWVHYAATKLGRGELFECMDTITFIRSQVLGPLLAIANGQPPRGVRRVEQWGGPAVEELAETIPLNSRESCYRALLACIGMYVRLREPSGDLVVRREAEEIALAYLNDVYVRAQAN
ncbi:oxalate:formate antiporter [Cohnella nanjingensis]|uniref:Oxalate:formate antiporter n=1 Tax=Cohnella nanjingensis TaxID=1387779 RepID=A0A7X0RYI7_9BACL|nr:oxalate:formate antiporter [Cohnella nanjingensis]MBB6674685.1 oxalate:formate antiporter [Cohnella nanjingensis]